MTGNRSSWPLETRLAFHRVKSTEAICRGGHRESPLVQAGLTGQNTSTGHLRPDASTHVTVMPMQRTVCYRLSTSPIFLIATPSTWQTLSPPPRLVSCPSQPTTSAPSPALRRRPFARCWTARSSSPKKHERPYRTLSTNARIARAICVSQSGAASTAAKRASATAAPSHAMPVSSRADSGREEKAGADIRAQASRAVDKASFSMRLPHDVHAHRQHRQASQVHAQRTRGPAARTE